jgi:phage terminase small subunit
MTPKQEAFCQAVADGKNQSEAYRYAYDAANMKADTINKKAYELMKDGQIAARIQELRGQLAARSLWTREQSITVVIEAIEKARGNNRPSDMIKGVEVLNRMHGYDAPIKHEVTEKKNVADLSDEELQAICDNLIEREIEERQRAK